MEVVAKVFSAGNSQAVRLPKAFRLDVPEVWISKDEVSGVITLRPKDDERRKKNLAELFRLIREEPFTENFIPPRSDEVRPNPLEEWEAPALPERPKPARTAKRIQRAAKAAP